MLDAGGDPRTAVRAVFSWSYQHLDADAARLFRLVGLHPGLDFDVLRRRGAGRHHGRARPPPAGRAGPRAPDPAAAAPRRYALHDLLRAYAHELASIHDGEGEQRAALTRLFDYYLQASAAAMDTLFPAEAASRPTLAPPARCALPPVEDLTAAREWLDAERANLAATAVTPPRMAGPAMPSASPLSCSVTLTAAVTSPRPSSSTATPVTPPHRSATPPPRPTR